MRSCPRCGAQVEVYRDRCDCGFDWAPQSSAGNSQDIQLPGEFRYVAEVAEPGRASIWPWVVGVLLIGVGGWHVVSSERLEASIYEYIKPHLVESPVDASLELHIQPLTNLVSIKLNVTAEGAGTLKPSEKLMIDAALSYIRSEVEPYIERELSLVARKQVDLYAMAFPYRIDFTLDISPKE